METLHQPLRMSRPCGAAVAGPTVACGSGFLQARPVIVATMTRSHVVKAPPIDPSLAPLSPGDDRSASPNENPLPVRQRRLTIVLILVALMLLAPGVWIVFLPQATDVGTPLGASAEVAGGLARINGVIPLDSDGWRPPEPAGDLKRPPGPGMHRVRILLELTALDHAGIRFSAADYAVEGLGDVKMQLLWSGPERQTVEQGESLNATLVFEIPDRNVALALTGENDLRLALGAGHHQK